MNVQWVQYSAINKKKEKENAKNINPSTYGKILFWIIGDNSRNVFLIVCKNSKMAQTERIIASRV